jgi:hypothetical protein
VVKSAKPHDGAESLGQGPLLAFPSLALQCACCLCSRVSAHGTVEALGCCCVVSAVERATFDVVRWPHGRADALSWCPVVCATEHVRLIVEVTPAWLGRCSQLVPSHARCLVNVFLALRGRHSDQDTRRTH